jgi:cyclopropane fatty-acyl-phospholipid synthase-like methyltransferase
MSEWYTTFFRGVALELWEAAVSPEQTLEEAAFLLHHLKLTPGASVLDVPCGNGRHALALARLGMRVTGVDIATEWIVAARDAAERDGAAVTFVEGDMRAIPAGRFDAAFCFGNSFGYLDRAGDNAFVGAVAAQLSAGGRFAIQTFSLAESVLPDLEAERTFTVGAITMKNETHYDVRESRMHTTRTFIKRGVSDARLSEHTIYTSGELIELCRSHGLELVTALADTAAGAPYALGAPQAVLVFEKREAKKA